MSSCDGEDLLKVFKDLHIETGNLSPNVIKAWFDTDCKDMKNLLNWMCNSLSKDNYLSAQQNLEYSELESPLVGVKYEKELNLTELQYPGLFQTELNEFDIEIAEDEIDLFMEEEYHADEILTANENISKSLTRELTEVTSEEIKSSIKCKEAQEECSKEAERLEEVNKKIHTQILNYGSKLYDFEFSPFPNFFNNIDISDCQDKFDNTMVRLKSILKDYNTGLNGESLYEDDSLNITLTTIRNRLFHSQRNYLTNKMEEEKLIKILAYLNNCSAESVLSLVESIYLQLNVESKEEQIFGMIENLSNKFSDNKICQPKLRHALKELEIYNTKLNQLDTISKTEMKILAIYLVMSILYKQEKKNIDSSDNFLRKILNYITKDLHNCVTRTNKMQQITDEYENYTKTLKDKEKYKLIYSMIQLIQTESENKSFTLAAALETFCNFKNEIHSLEKQLLSNNTFDIQTKQFLSDIYILQKFLVCGPTHRVVLVPSELQNIFQDVDEMLKKQNSANKLAMGITLQKMANDKWQQYRRQLWIYFITNPTKMLSVIQQMESHQKQHKSDISKRVAVF